MDNAVKRVLNYLRRFGDVYYEGYDFSGDRPEYACLEIEMNGLVAEGLEEYINGELSERNGFSAKMRFIALSEMKSYGKYRYYAEVVPYDYVSRDNFEKVTKQFLHSLPKAIKNFAMRNNCKNYRNKRK